MHLTVTDSVGAGLNLFLAIVLIAAGISKSRDIQSVERLLVSTLPRRVWRVRGIDSRRLGRGAATIEAVGGVALLVAPRAVYPVVIGALALPLTVILAVAVRAALRKVPCACFGGSTRAADPYAVGRAVVIALTGLGLCLVTWVDGHTDPTITSLTASSWAVAIVMTAAALAPAVRLKLSRRDSADTPAPDVVAAGRSRREVLHGLGLATAVITAAAVVPNALTARGCAATLKSDGPPICAPRCQAAYDRCVGAEPGEKPCCIDCFVSCQNYEHKCNPGVSCSGAWHDPFGFGF